ncbi:microspherule protein 1-like [Dysidea avara]|uniref:microspherule protein 1-like n=1 Tax=Dysidea avara TaxID=196820 RepID=UPI003334756E
MSTSSSQPNFAGIQTLITPTSQYVFPPSIFPPDQSPTTTQPSVAAVHQDGQIQKYPPFVGQAVTTSTSVQLASRLGILNSSAVTTTTAGTKRVLTVSKPSPSAGKTPKSKPSKLTTPVANSKGSLITKSTKKIKLDSSYFTPPTVKATPRKKTSSISSSATKTLSTPGSAVKAVRKTPRMKAGAAVSNMGRWHPSDDLALISAVQQTNDLAAVYRGVKFSCKFTQKEIEERWHALLLDRHLSKLAMTAVKALPSSITATVLKQSLWSEAEEQILAGIPSTEDVNLEKFTALLGTRGSVFHYTRTPQSLYRHWSLMKQFDLLDDQEVAPIGPAEDVTEFSDVEDQVIDSDINKPRDSKEEALEQELTLADQVAKKEIIQLEQNILEWQKVLGVPSHIAFDDGVFAVWKGKRVQFEMRSRQVTIGRNSSTSEMDFDLSLEGDTHRLSRKQAVMAIKDDGNFVLYNCGRRPVYIDGQPLLTDKSVVLRHNQLIEVCNLSFLLLLNHQLVNTSLQSTTLC